jgi:hypothetical protein
MWRASGDGYGRCQERRGRRQTLERPSRRSTSQKRTFQGQTIWEITQEEGLAEETELMIEGAGFVSAEVVAPKEPEIEDDTKLPNMAMTVFLDHLVVSTHVDFIQDLIKLNGQANGLAQEKDSRMCKCSVNWVRG